MVLEIVGSLLFAAGLVVLVLAAMHGVVELAGLRRIGAPPPRTFARMITQATHRQTIALPAIGALVAGWLVSSSASFV